MNEPLENEYFNWLCAKVLESNGRMYHSLLRMLYQTEFVWVVPADRHRAADGIELRLDFARETFIKRDRLWEAQPCSLLEVFLAFAKRASFQTDIPVRKWFWIFMENLQLDQFRQVSYSDIPLIDKIIHVFIWRTYDRNGYGGLFPITSTRNDQTKVELWYQFCEYVDDRGIM